MGEERGDEDGAAAAADAEGGTSVGVELGIVPWESDGEGVAVCDTVGVALDEALGVEEADTL